MTATACSYLRLSPKGENSIHLEEDQPGASDIRSSTDPLPTKHVEGIESRRRPSREERWDTERAACEQRISMLERKVEEQKRTISRLRKERNDAEAALEVARQTTQRVETEWSRAYNGIKGQKKEILSERNRIATTYNELLQEHDQVATQLRSAKALMGTNDDVSAEEIKVLVKDINVVITQIANALSDGVRLVQEQPENSSDVSRARLSNFLADSFISELRARDHAEDNILVQYGIQACLSYHVGRGTARFHVNLTSSQDAFLIRLFGKLQTSSSQAIATHWRSLTHQACADLGDEHRGRHFTDDMIEDIRAVFEIARCTPAVSGWEERVTSLLEASNRLSSIIQQKAYSKSYFTTLPTPGDRFDPDRMQDVLKSLPHRLDSPVSCTVALGLAYAVHAKEGTTQVVQIFPPEVVQVQSLGELLND